MANQKISALPSATSLTGAEVIPIVQGGVNKKVTKDVLTAFPASNVLSGTAWDGSFKYLLLTANTALTFATAKRSGAILIKQDGTGSRTLSIGGRSVAVNTAANSYTLVTFVYYDAISNYIFSADPNAFTIGSFTAPITPAAPTTGVVDDTANTFNWTNNSSYTTLSQYEYTLDGGSTWSSVTAKPLVVGDVAKAIGQVGVRVKAIGIDNPSAGLYNTTAFTVGADTTPPTITGATISNPDTDRIVLATSESLPSLTLDASKFTVTKNGSPVTLPSAAQNGGVTLFLPSPAISTDVFTVAYAAGTSGARIQDTAGNFAASITSPITVTNTVSGITYTTLEDKTFTAVADWSQNAASGSTVEIVSGALHLVSTTGGACLVYKAGVFTVGDILRITLTSVVVTSGSPKIAVGAASGAENINALANGTNVFTIDTTGATGNYILIGIATGNFEATIPNIKIEKQN